MADVRVTPSITLREQYDSNAGFADRSQEVKSDYETSISPRLEVMSDSNRLQLRGIYQMHSRFYSRDPDLNYVGHSLNLSLGKPISEKTSFSISDMLTSTRDSREVDETGIQTGRTRILSNTASLGLDHQLTQKISIGLSLSNAVTKYDDTAFQDNRTDSASLSGHYQWSREISTSMRYGYSIYRFDNNQAESDIKSQSVDLSLGYVKPYSPTISINMSAGASYISRIDSSYNLIANAAITKGFQNSTLNLGYSRGVSGASGVSADVNINENITTSWSYSASRTFTFGINGGISKNRSTPSGAVDTTSYNSGINCGWQAKSWLNVGAGYSHLKQESDTLLVNDISRDLFYVNMSAAYNNWRF